MTRWRPRRHSRLPVRVIYSTINPFHSFLHSTLCRECRIRGTCTFANKCQIFCFRIRIRI